MDNADFDQVDSFFTLWQAWPSAAKKLDDPKKAQAVFNSFVVDSTWMDDFLEKATELSKEKYPPTLTSYLTKFFRTVAPPVTQNKVSQLGLAQEDLPELRLDVFRKIWVDWPKNPNAPEREQPALTAWCSAIKKHGVDTVEKVSRHYIKAFSNPLYGMVHPYHFGNFLTKDNGELFETFQEQEKVAWTDADMSDFDSVYSWYPEFESKRELIKDSFIFYARHIKPDVRFDFLMAVKAYRKKVLSKQEQVFTEDLLDTNTYVKKFIGFVGTWKNQVKAVEVANALAINVYSAIEHIDTGRKFDQWIHGAICHICQSSPEKTVKIVVCEVLQRVKQWYIENQASDKVGLLEAIDIDGIIAKSYYNACKLEQSVVNYTVSS